MGGTLRDLAATTYAFGTACASTALAYFFHNSSSSRGMLPLGAIDAGLYTDDEVPVVRAFAEKVLTLMGTESKWIGNFAVRGGQGRERQRRHPDRGHQGRRRLARQRHEVLRLPLDIADYYLVTARLEGVDGLDGLALFLVDRRGEGVRAAQHWNGLGMRASDNDGCILEDAFVPDDMALTLPGGFQRATQVARGTWVGNQVAIASIYAGIARAPTSTRSTARWPEVRRHRRTIASSPMHQVMIGEAEKKLEEVHMWLRRQSTSRPASRRCCPTPRSADWRITKGAICERRSRSRPSP